MTLTTVVQVVKFCHRKSLLTLSSYSGLVHILVKTFYDFRILLFLSIFNVLCEIKHFKLKFGTHYSTLMVILPMPC